MFSDSAPPNRFLHKRLTYALPSVFPTSVPVCSFTRGSSFAFMKKSRSVGVEDGSVLSGLSTCISIGSLKISNRRSLSAAE